MKKLQVLLINFIIISSISAQNPYYDAFVLKNIANPELNTETNEIILKVLNQQDSIFSIFRNYQSKEIMDEIDSLKSLYNSLEKQIKSNPNKKDSLEKKQKEVLHNRKQIRVRIRKDIDKNNPFVSISGKVNSSESGNMLKSQISSTISGIGGLNVATFADEFSQFLIDRAKQELNIAFFNRLKVFFEKTPEIQVLFPKTTDALGNLLSYEYPTMIKTLRNAFHDDLEDVFFKTDDVFKLPKYKAFIKEFPEVILSLKTIQVIAEIDNERHPADIIGDFKDIPEWKEYEADLSKGLYNFHSALETGYLFSQSTRFTTFDKPFELKDLGRNNVIIQIDSAIAEAEKKKIFKIDTMQSEDIKVLSDKLAKNIRENIDETKLLDTTYLPAFLSNLFGQDYGKVSLPSSGITNTEDVINQVTQVVRNNDTKYLTDNSYVVKKYIKSFNSERAWVTRQHLNYLIQDDVAFKIYLGLLYQQSKNASIAIKLNEQKIEQKITLIKDSIFLAGSMLKKGSVIKKESRLNGNVISADMTMVKDLIIEESSLIKKDSEIEAESIIHEGQFIHSVLESNKDDLFKIRDYLVELIELAEEVDKTFKEIKEKQKEGEKIQNEELYKYINTGIDVVEYTSDISYLFQDDIGFEPYLKIARNGNDMYLNVVKKEYTSAVSNLSSIIDLLVNQIGESYPEVLKSELSNTKSDIKGKKDEIKSKKDEIKQSENQENLAASKKNYSKAEKIKKSKIKSNVEVLALAVELDQLQEVKQGQKADKKEFSMLVGNIPKILKYGTFMANIVQSDSAAEIRSAIEAAALPVGSFTIKRESRWNMSLNAYLGGYYGKEKLNNNSSTELSSWSKSYGVWVPIGIAASYGLGRHKNCGSVSLFLSLIDLGAVVSFRLQNPVSMDTTFVADDPMTTNMDETNSMKTTSSINELPEIQLKNIIAPGIYAVYGIPKVPISIGGGVQRGPQLREITTLTEVTEDGTTTEMPETVIESSAWRWQLFIAVDIPIVNLFSRSK